MMDQNKNNKRFLKCFLAIMIIVTFVCLINISESLAQWSNYSNVSWPSQTFLGSSFFSFNPISSYIGSFNNSFSMPYGSYSSPGLYSFQGLRYANQNTGIYPELINYNNYTSGTSYTPFPAVLNFSSTLNPYMGLLSPGSWSNSYPWQNAPLFSTPYYLSAPSVVNVASNNGWPGIFIVPWIQYPTQPPVSEDDRIIIKNTKGLLETRIRDALGLDLTEPITTKKALTLASLDASRMCQEKWVTISGNGSCYPTHKIKCEPPIDISLLAELTNLTDLNLNMNTIGDISPLAELTNLNKLILCNTNTNDLRPLAELTNLTYLDIHGAEISDLSPLAGLINLTELNLLHNKISDLSPLAGLINLTYLNLGENEISDLSPLAGLTNLKELDLHDNIISKLSPLAGLINLKELELKDNIITDLSPLTGLINLQKLWLYGNEIKDISPLAELNNLRYVSFRGNDNLDSGNCPVINALISKGVSVQTDLNCQ